MPVLRMQRARKLQPYRTTLVLSQVEKGMTIPFKKYLVWRCPNCGKWQGKQNNKWTYSMSEAGKAQAIKLLKLKCSYCRKTKTFKDSKQGGAATDHYWCDHPSDATRLVQELSKREWERKAGV